jgi:predicted transcriptional regulator
MARPTKTARLTVRLTDECDRLIQALCSRYGISTAAVVEMAVREYAEAREIKPKAGEEGG